jgi:ribonuclease VapC
MIVDSSALVAILLEEPEGHLFDVAMLRSSFCVISSTTLFEASMILQSRRGRDGVVDLDGLILRLGIEVLPFTESQALIARRAFESYGKGRHAAGLNFGDCMVYAAAKESGEELLFKGTDFGQTDIAVAAY